MLAACAFLHYFEAEKSMSSEKVVEAAGNTSRLGYGPNMKLRLDIVPIKAADIQIQGFSFVLSLTNLTLRTTTTSFDFHFNWGFCIVT